MYTVFSYTIIIASLIGAVRFKKILSMYRPFIYVVWAGLINEMVSTLAIKLYKDDTINNNIYTLVDFTLLLWLFYSWDELGRKKRLYQVVLAAGLLVWLGDNLILHSLNTISSYFRIFYAIALVYFSVEELNRLLFTQTRRLAKNAKFIICVALLVFYAYKAVFEVFFVLTVRLSNHFYYNLCVILAYINLFANLMYAIAMLWLPTKRQFTLPY